MVVVRTMQLIMNNFSVDSMFNRYRKMQLDVCKEYEFTPSDVFYLATTKDRYYTRRRRVGRCCSHMSNTFISRYVMKLNLKDYVQRIQLISSEQADQTIKELDQTAWKDFDYKGSENICVQDNPSLPYQVTEADFPNLSDTVSKAVDNYINNFLKDLPWFSYWNGKTRFFWIKYPAGSDGMGVHADHR